MGLVEWSLAAGSAKRRLFQKLGTEAARQSSWLAPLVNPHPRLDYHGGCMSLDAVIPKLNGTPIARHWLSCAVSAKSWQEV